MEVDLEDDLWEVEPISASDYHRLNASYMDIEEVSGWEQGWQRDRCSAALEEEASDMPELEPVAAASNTFRSTKKSGKLGEEGFSWDSVLRMAEEVDAPDLASTRAASDNPDIWDPASASTKELRLKYSKHDDLYDEDADDADTLWAERQRANGGAGRSDAVLSCPCCFGVVCYDCQRHDRIASQYRAVFAVNCTVLSDELRAGHVGSEAFRPVICSACEAEIGVFDNSDTYHFFNVIPGA